MIGDTGSERKTEANVSVYFICDCCGQSFEIQDVEAVLRSLHLQNTCPAMEGVLFRKE